MHTSYITYHLMSPCHRMDLIIILVEMHYCRINFLHETFFPERIFKPQIFGNHLSRLLPFSKGLKLQKAFPRCVPIFLARPRMNNTIAIVKYDNMLFVSGKEV